MIIKTLSGSINCESTVLNELKKIHNYLECDNIKRALGINQSEISRFMSFSDEQFLGYMARRMKLNEICTRPIEDLFNVYKKIIENICKRFLKGKGKEKVIGSSSSNILVQMQKYVDWYYPGFCPRDPINRLNSLMCFPFHDFDLTKEEKNALNVEIKVPQLCSLPNPNVFTVPYIKIPKEESYKRIVHRLKNLKDSLIKVEQQYIDYAKNIGEATLKISKI